MNSEDICKEVQLSSHSSCCISGCHAKPHVRPAPTQVLGELLCGRAEDMPDVIKRDSSRLPTGLKVGMVQVGQRSCPTTLRLLQGAIVILCGVSGVHNYGSCL